MTIKLIKKAFKNASVDIHPCPECGAPCLCDGISADKHWMTCKNHGLQSWTQEQIDKGGLTKWVD